MRALITQYQFLREYYRTHPEEVGETGEMDLSDEKYEQVLTGVGMTRLDIARFSLEDHPLDAMSEKFGWVKHEQPTEDSRT